MPSAEPPARPRLWVAAAALAYLAALVPLWWPRFLPLLDLPNHLGTIALWHRLPDPSWRYQPYYQYNRVPVPYWGYWYPTHLLAYVFSVETANKVFLSLYAAAVPASVVSFARRFDRDPRLAVFAFPLIFNTNFGYGFISYCAGLPAVLFAMVLLDRQLERPSAGRLTALFAVTLGTLALHVLPWMALGACAAVVLLARARPWRRGVGAALVLAATVPLAMLSFRLSQRSLPNGSQTIRPRISGRFESFTELARELPNRVLTTWPGRLDEALMIALGVIWLLLLVTSLRGRRRARWRLALWVPELCAAVALAGYLFLPYRTYQPIDWWYISPRLLTAVLLFGVVLIRGPILGARQWLLGAALAASLAYPLLLARQFRQFDARAQQFASLMERVPRGSSTLTLLIPPHDDDSVDQIFVPYTDFHSYAQMLSGGYNPYREYFALGFPVVSVASRRLPAPPFFHPYDFNPRTQGSLYDFVMTRNEPRDYFLFGTARPPLVGRAGAFRLYSTKQLAPR